MKRLTPSIKRLGGWAQPLALGLGLWIMSPSDAVAQSGQGPASALQLNGTTGYARTTNSIAPSAISRLTYEVWFKANTFTGGQPFLLAQPNNTLPGNGAVIYLTGGTAGGATGIAAQLKGTTLSGAFTFTTGVWYHVALTYDGVLGTGNNTILFVNGLQVATSRPTTGTLGPFSNPLVIGANRTGAATYTNFLNGNIEEVRVWNTVRSRNELRESRHTLQTPGSSNLVAYYRFDSLVDDGDPSLTGGETLTLAGNASLTRSTAPLALGDSDVQNHNPGNTSSFNNENINQNFMTFADNIEPIDRALRLRATELDTIPANPPTGAGIGRVADRYYIIESFDTVSPSVDQTPGTYTANLTLMVPLITYFGSNPSTIQLYRRPKGASLASDWTLVSSASSVGGSGTMATFQLNTATVLENQLYVTGLPGTDAALPVELQGFSAAAGRNGVELTWRTQTEQDNAGFILIRDGIEIAGPAQRPELRGQGTTGLPITYRYTDRAVRPGQTHRYTIASVDFSGVRHTYDVEATVHMPDQSTAQPIAFQLRGATPNPFNPTTSIRFDLPEASSVTLTVFNTLGMQVATQTATLGGGTQAMSFDGSALASGTYLYRLTAQGTQTFVANGRFTLVR